MSSFITRSSCPSCNSVSIAEVLKCKDHTVSGEVFEIWQCDDCKLRFTQNVPDQQSIGPYYQSNSYISHTDTENGLVNKLYKIARNYTLSWKTELMRRHLGKDHGNLLDIGAGTGAFVHKALRENWLVTGLEPDEGARVVASEKYNIQLGNPESLFELPSAQFDVITMWHVLEHVHQLHEYLEQIKRLLKEDGIALIALPNYTSADASHYGVWWAAYDVPRHLYHFAPLSLKKLAAMHQLRVDAIRPMWLDAFYVAMLSERYKTGKTNLSAAILNGTRSNLNARRQIEACSSLVYIVRNHKI